MSKLQKRAMSETKTNEESIDENEDPDSPPAKSKRMRFLGVIWKSWDSYWICNVNEFPVLIIAQKDF